MSLSCTVSETQRDSDRKLPILTYSCCILHPTLGVTPLGFRKDFWRQKTRVPALPCDVIYVILCLAILI